MTNRTSTAHLTIRNRCWVCGHQDDLGQQFEACRQCMADSFIGEVAGIRIWARREDFLVLHIDGYDWAVYCGWYSVEDLSDVLCQIPEIDPKVHQDILRLVVLANL